MYTQDPAFWRAGAISSTAVMFVVLIVLTIDSVAAIGPGGSHVPPYDVINQKIGYRFDSARNEDAPTIDGEDLLFKRHYTEPEAAALLGRGKLVIQSRACMDCHTFFGNGAYYAPDLTKAWLDPIWTAWGPMYGAKRRDEAIVDFLMHPDRFPLGDRIMPNLGVSEDEAKAVVAYLKWMSAVDTNGFPAGFLSASPR
jgi:nitric oxide reductase subunit C